MTGYPSQVVTPVTDLETPKRHLADVHLGREAWTAWQVTRHDRDTRQPWELQNFAFFMEFKVELLILNPNIQNRSKDITNILCVY